LYIDEDFGWHLSFSLNDDNGTLPSNTSLKIIVNGTTYNSKPDKYGYYSPYSRQCDFIILDNDNKPVQQIMAVLNGVESSLQFNGAIPIVHLKSYEYGVADITQAPQNITATYSANSIFVNLVRYAYYRIERSVNSGSFAKVDSNYTSSYTDTNISGNTTYSYRALRSAYYYYYSGYSAFRQNNYTNTVSIKTP
jgi:hypothetical protein